MKKIAFLIFSLFFFSTVFGEIKPAAVVSENLRTAYAEFSSAAQLLAITAHDPTKDLLEKTIHFKKAHLAYKKIEAIIAFLDHEYVGDNFNGAPLPRIARKTSQLVVVDPSGLQTMGEALLAEDLEIFANLATTLHQRALEFTPFINQLTLSEQLVFESMREALVRLATLGITGFDSPLEEQALPACLVVTQSLENTLNTYQSFCSTEEIALQKELFAHAKNRLTTANFNTFDRYAFIQEFINPLYKELLLLQKKLHIQTRDLGKAVEYSVNYSATNIFDTDFLNYRYFSAYSNAGDPKKREELGRLLFFDPVLSHDNERACASCHNPEKAFTDGQAKSIASNNLGTVQRNSPGLINSAYSTRFFWDVRASAPEDQIEHVIFNEKEFNTNYDEILAKLAGSKAYLEYFSEAYPELQNSRFPAISRYTLVASISAYLQSLRSFNSPFDKSIKGEIKADKETIAGFNIFAGKAKCATCHFIPTFAGNIPPLFTDTETEIIGVPNTTDRSIAILDEDMGRYANGRPKEKAPHQKNAFKTVSLRNVALTAPYMHNGVFPTLEEVMDFYNVGGGHGWGIAPENATLSADSLQLTPMEITQVIYFLKSLTDTNGLTTKPKLLPTFADEKSNKRTIGGSY